MIVPRLLEEEVQAAPYAEKTSYYLLESGQNRGRPVRAQNGDQPVPGFGIRVHRRKKVYVLRHQGKTHVLGEVGLISLEEARRRARRKRLEILEGPPPPEKIAKRKTIRDLYITHLDSLRARERSGDLRARTVEGYKFLWEKHILPGFPGAKLADVTPERLENWKRGRADSPVVFNRALQQLSAAFRLAVRFKWVPENPCDAVAAYGERPSDRMLSSEEIVEWVSALAGLEEENRLSRPEAAALWALFYSGARPGEILRARWEWVKIIKASPDGARPILKISLPEAKGDRKGRPAGRVVRVPPPASEAILAVRDELGHSEYMIPGKLSGQGIRSRRLQSIRRAFALVCARAGIKGATPKVLRHVWRSVAPEAGVDKEHLRQLGGWSSHKVPDSVYIHERDAALDTGALRIAKRLKEVSSG